MPSTNIWQQFKALIPEGARSVVTITGNDGDGTSTATLRDGTTVRVQGENVGSGSKALIEGMAVKAEVPALAAFEAEV